MRQQVLVSVILLVLAPLSGRAQETLSPKEALESQNESILGAESLDEVIEHVPEHARSQVEQMSQEEKAAALKEWQEGVASVRLVRERVADGRGVVLLESEDGARLLSMTLEDGRWTLAGESYLATATPGARGGFTVSGAVEYELAEGVVSQTGLNGIPVLTVSDPLEEELHQRDVPTVQLALPQCLEAGSHSLEAREAGNVTVRSQFWHSTDEEQKREFEEVVTGNLEVESIEGDRFSGSFELRAETESGEAVSVEGWIEDARVQCDERDS